MSKAFDTIQEPYIVCPYCGHQDRNSWEVNFGPGMEGEESLDCGECGEVFIATREVSVSYSTRKFKPDENRPMNIFKSPNNEE